MLSTTTSFDAASTKAVLEEMTPKTHRNKQNKIFFVIIVLLLLFNGFFLKNDSQLEGFETDQGLKNIVMYGHQILRLRSSCIVETERYRR
mmetsp:Transcript_5723/g.12508  ORF Transcript_5723/g.12508 Transcript_5723/m.12508 type:complete len:90 (-) Transcript_5723:37-306(-)